MLKRFFLYIIGLYQRYISPLTPSACRYLPTCSTYARECFESLPIHTALYRSTKRILSCHPWSRGGYNPVHPTNCDCKRDKNSG